MTNKVDFYAIRGYKEYQVTLRVNANLTNYCNNDCWYCNGKFSDVKKAQAHFLTKDQFRELLKFINYQDKRKIYLTIIGGEPTLNKNLPYMMRKADKELRQKNIYIVTNLLKPLSYFKTLPLRERAFEFVCSYHSHAISDYKEWFKKVDYLYENKCLNTVFLMLTEDNIDKIKEIYDKYRGKYKNIFADKPVVQAYAINQFGYTEKYKKLCEMGMFEPYNVHIDCKNEFNLTPEGTKVILSDGTNDYLNYQKYKNFYFMMCLCGIQVHANGCITRCLHDQYRRSIHVLGKKQEIKKFNLWHLCRHKLCKCDLDFPKASAKYYMEKFKK